MLLISSRERKLKDKIRSFQILRTVAMCLIFLSHCDYLVLKNNDNVLMYLGGAGVSLFIALSGFLAATKDYNVSGVELYKKRWKQFYKCHFLTLIIAFPLTIKTLKCNFLIWLGELIANFTLAQAIVPSRSVYFSFNAVAWYLSLMLFFTLMIPIAVRIWNRLSIRFIIVLSTLVLSEELLMVVVFEKYKFFHWLVYIFPFTRFFDFVLGGAYYKIALFIKKRELVKMNYLLFLISSLIMLVLIIGSCFYGSSYYLTAVWTIPSSILVTALYNIRIEKKMGILVETLIYFGGVTFEFFLIHQLVIIYLTKILAYFSFPYVLIYVLAFVSSVLGAFFLRYMSKLWNRRIKI